MLKPLVAGVSVASALGLPLSLVTPAAAASKRCARSRSMPAHIAGTFNDLAACHTTPDGDYLVFDRRAHSVYRVPPKGPRATDHPDRCRAGPHPPAARLRFGARRHLRDRRCAAGHRTRPDFLLSGRSGRRVHAADAERCRTVALGDLVLSGVGSLDYTGKTVLVSHPSSGALVTEYALDGRVLRTFGELRAHGPRTGPRAAPGAQRRDRDRAARTAAGSTSCSSSGVPAFRKYDAAGKTAVRAAHRGDPSWTGTSSRCRHSGRGARRRSASSRSCRHRSGPRPSIRTAICGCRW